jgi:MarR family transcriptional regulator, organic hydroperoxide resistance regulator
MSTKDYIRRLRTAMHELTRAFCLRDPLVSGCDVEVTPPQMHTIVALSHGPMSMSELGRRLGVSGPTMTGVIDRLEKQSLVVRQRDEDDRRVVRLSLTAAGRKVHEQFESAFERRLNLLLELLDEKDRKNFVAIFERLAERVLAQADSQNRERMNADAP